ncbi:fumarylacetoacetate hydrolase family protein [Variovorax sp. J22R24]|uniref:2-keto-4-pentenoate hydratase n=1 Tax=Variovorax gracilis TaxID=3053502 RepID=UPI002578CFC7|nr:fumarylacetoacetate hydrolase family protein [Variovorax sp. J22R24]MDM0105696.1 fumarylacetoacetate hydrolase family protein [Variovorax sp. J22R24]
MAALSRALTASAPVAAGDMPQAAALALSRARRDGRRVPSALLHVRSRDEAYAIQDATLAAIGPIGGWKVGATAPSREPICAPLPAAGLVSGGSALQGTAWHLRGTEAEVAFRLGSDLPPRPSPYTRDEVALAIASVLPVIEVAESRLADWLDADPAALLADLLCHGGLVLGEAAPFNAAWFDLQRTEVVMRFGDQVVAHTIGENTHPDVGGLLAWLANHCVARGASLQAGQIITTGSCTGMLFASQGTPVHVKVSGLAPLSVFF